MRLDELLNDLYVFEVVDYTRTKSGKEICLGRTTNEEKSDEIWFHMFGAVLMAQLRKRQDFLSVSKQYLIRGDSLVYLWKIVCTVTDRLREYIPRVDKTYKAQQQYSMKINPDGTGEATLLGMEGLEAGPQPEDYGLGSDIKR
jgi:hypothetical protein